MVEKISQKSFNECKLYYNEVQSNEWKAVKYLIENADKLFIGIGIPSNEALISLDEVYQIGERIAGWSPDVQVCAID
jgi:hypothetical protein